jgi:IclR family acetate operon transcriptional repressor
MFPMRTNMDIESTLGTSPAGDGPPGPEPGTVVSVEKALAIVELLLRNDVALSAREVALQTGINRSTAHRLLSVLVARGWAERASAGAGYRLSLRFLALARTALHGRDFVDEVRPALERLSALSRETVHLGVLDGFEVVHVDKVDSPEMVGVSSKVGTRAVPHVTALGKALLAASPDDLVATYLAHARAISSPYRLIDEAALLRDLRRARERGYSLDDEESTAGVRCLGVAIRGSGGVPLFAISMTGPSARFTAERATACVPEMVAVAAALSAQFGWSSPVAAGAGLAAR